jgi:ubiquinone/menaquinone biosynthesis C-methylase UbiE
MPGETQYVHGYTAREAQRLRDHADTLSVLLHDGISYRPGRRVLEVGCGTGAQTVFLAASSPGAAITSIDLSPVSVERARARVAAAGRDDVAFAVANLFALPFADHAFDDLFVCFVLEHLPEPEKVLLTLRRVLRPGGTITVIEGDHGSWYCHPQGRDAARAVACLIEVQARLGGDSLVGRRLYPLLAAAGFQQVRVTPRMVYVDDSRPDQVEGFSKNTFIAMVEGVRDQAISLGMIDEVSFDRGIAELYRATEPGGTFCYTFFRAIGLS